MALVLIVEDDAVVAETLKIYLEHGFECGADDYVPKPFSPREGVARAFGPDYDGLDRTMDSHITNLRRKLHAGQGRRYIATVHGLGLAIVRHLVEVHGWRVLAESDADSVTAGFALPRGGDAG